MAGDFNDVVSTVNILYTSTGSEKIQKELQNVMKTMSIMQKHIGMGGNQAIINTRQNVRALQLLNTEIGNAVRPSAKSFSDASRHLSVLSNGLKNNQSVVRSSAVAYNNLNKYAQNYFNVAQKPLTTLQRMRVQLDGIGAQVSSIGLHWQSVAKNMQWTGRQMMVGLTLPIVAGAGLAIKQWQSVNKEIVRVAKVMDDFEGKWASAGSGMDKTASAQENLYKAARKMGHEYAAVDQIVLAVMGDFAAMGYETQKQLKGVTDLALKTAALGEVDVSDATLAVRSIMAIFGKNVKEAEQTLAVFNQIENKTALAAKDLIEAFPEVANSAKQFGLTAEQTAAALAAMYERGVSATEGAHALKFTIASLVKPTKQTLDQIEAITEVAPELGNVFAAIATGSLKGEDALKQMSITYKEVEKALGSAEASKLLSNLVGKRQANRMIAMMDSIREGLSGIETDWLKATQAGDDYTVAMKNAKKEMDALRASDAFRMDQAKADFKAFITALGKTLMPVVLDWFEKLNEVGKKFLKILKENPGLQKLIIGFGALLAVIGPIVYITGQLGVAFTTVLHGAGKLVWTLPKIKAGFMNAAEATRFLKGDMVIVGDEILDLKGRWVKFFETFKNSIKSMLGFKQAQTDMNALLTSATFASSRAMDDETAAIIRNTLAVEGNSAAKTRQVLATAGLPVGRATSTIFPGIAAADEANMFLKLKRFAKEANTITSGPSRYGAANAAGVKGISFRSGGRFASLASLKKDAMATYLDDVAAGLAPPPLTKVKPWQSEFNYVGTGKSRMLVPTRHGINPRSLPRYKGRFQSVSNLVSRIGSYGPNDAGKDFQSAAQIFSKKTIGGKYPGGLVPKVLGLTQKWEAKGGWAQKIFAPLNSGLTKVLGKVPAGGILGKLLGAKAGGAAAIPGMQTGLMGAVTSHPIVALVTAIIVALVAFLPLMAKISGHWKEFWSGVTKTVAKAKDILKGAWEKFKEGLNSILNGLKAFAAPFIKIYNLIAEALGGGTGSKKDKQKSGWETLGEIWAGILVILAKVADALAEIFKLIGKILEIAGKVIGKLLEWTLVPFTKAIIWAVEKLVDLFNWISRIAEKLKSLPLIGGLFDTGGVGDALGSDLEAKILPVITKIKTAIESGVNLSSIKMWFSDLDVVIKQFYKSLPDFLKQTTTYREFRVKIYAAYDLEPEKTIKKAGKDKAKKAKKKLQEFLDGMPSPTIPVMIEEDEPDNSAINDWLNALKSRLDEQINKIKERAMKNFEAMAKARLKVFDDQIKAIEDQEKAERELYETQEYLNNRRKILDDYALTKENYRRDRALAIYEGRYDDARNLDLQFQADTRNHNEQLTDIDDQRNRDLIQKDRDLHKERLAIQKEAEQERLDSMKQNLQDQLDAITEWTPKNVAEMINMVDQMNAALIEVGGQTMGPSMEIATWGWGEATRKAGRDITEAAFWSGASAANAAKSGIESVEANPDYQAYLDKAPKVYKDYLRALAVPKASDPPTYGGGGQRKMRHTGGMIGGRTASDVPATLQEGEYVLRRSAVRNLGLPLLHSLNKYHEGGAVGLASKKMIWGTFWNKLIGFASRGEKFGGYTWEDVKEKWAPKMFGGLGLPASAFYLGREIAMSPAELAIDTLQQILAIVFAGNQQLVNNILRGSKLRPGAITNVGNRSFHATGQALDIGDAGVGTEALWSVYNYLVANMEKFKIIELIWRDNIWKYGKWSPYGRSDHYDHVHVAVSEALSGLIPLANGGKVLVDRLPALLHKGEMVWPASMVERMEKWLPIVHKVMDRRSAQANAGGDTYITVENFIGQRQWFEEMMKEYNIKTLPSEQRKRGTINRVVSSRKDNSVRYV